MVSKLCQLIALVAYVKVALSVEISFRLYAYGTGIKSGLQLFYGDGKAYVGPNAPTFVSEGVNITMSTNDDDKEFIVTPNSTTPWDSEPTMYIDTTQGSINPVGFIKDNETLPSGAKAVGFGLYGGWAFHKDDDSTIEMNFIATSTNETDIYEVRWDAGGTKTDDDISISLRTQAPATIES